MSFHGLFCVFVVWVPSYAHHHLMDISISNTGPSIINASGYVSWKTVYYLFRKVSCGDAQLLGATAKAPHHLAPAEIRQMLHDAVRLGCGLRPRPQVRQSRRGGGARTPRTSRGCRAGARPAGRAGVQRPGRRRGHAGSIPSRC